MRCGPFLLGVLLPGVALAQDPAPTDATPVTPPEPAPTTPAPKSAGFPMKSTRGPFYLQATPLGYNHWASAPGNCGGHGCGGWPGFRPDIEFGMHFSGRHDGIVLAVKQSFIFTVGPDNVGGTTVLKLGYDLAFPIKSFEIVASPYTSAGIGYAFGNGGSIGFNAGFFGIEGKFFFLKNLYGFIRPFELGMQCFHSPTTNCWLQATTGAGVGLAFPTLAN